MPLKFSAGRMGIGAACLVLMGVSLVCPEEVFDSLAGIWTA